MTTPHLIDDYIRQVSTHLKLRGRKRREALADLLETLTEEAVATSEAQALANAGSAVDYAAELDAQFRQGRPGFATIAGIPNSFTRGVGERLANTFNPADARLLVPKVIGAGWSINMGAVAVRLGLLNPDDLDDEVLAEATSQLPASRAAASVPVALAGASALLLLTRRSQIPSGTRTINLAFGALTPLLAAAIIMASRDESLPDDQRLTMPGLAAALGLLTGGSNLQLSLRPGGQLIVLGATLVALPAELLFSYLPVRAALQTHWEQAR